MVPDNLVLIYKGLEVKLHNIMQVYTGSVQSSVLCVCVCCYRRNGWTAEFNETVPATDAWRKMIIIIIMHNYLFVNVIIEYCNY